MRSALYFLLSAAVVLIMGTTGAALSATFPRTRHLLIESAPLVFIGMLTLALSSKVVARHAGVLPVLQDAVVRGLQQVKRRVA